MFAEPRWAPIAGVAVIESLPFRDDRGAFARLFCDDALHPVNAGRPIVQINHSITRKVGALRGLHYQKPPHAEGKWVRCLAGRVWDVAVDLRARSPTFLQHFGVELSSKAMNAVFIPEGCAHGFQTLEPDCELLYLHTERYKVGAEAGVRWDDPRLGINWPLPVSEISARDRSHPLLQSSFKGIVS